MSERKNKAREAMMRTSDGGYRCIRCVTKDEADWCLENKRILDPTTLASFHVQPSCGKCGYTNRPPAEPKCALCKKVIGGDAVVIHGLDHHPACATDPTVLARIERTKVKLALTQQSFNPRDVSCPRR